MADHSAVLKAYYRDRIQNMHREANRLAIEVGLEARDKDDVDRLADAAQSLDTAVEILAHARSQLTTT